jgi:hypothetical protein
MKFIAFFLMLFFDSFTPSIKVTKKIIIWKIYHNEFDLYFIIIVLHFKLTYPYLYQAMATLDEISDTLR